jgi:hypothetical protein
MGGRSGWPRAPVRRARHLVMAGGLFPAATLESWGS